MSSLALCYRLIVILLLYLLQLITFLSSRIISEATQILDCCQMNVTLIESCKIVFRLVQLFVPRSRPKCEKPIIVSQSMDSTEVAQRTNVRTDSTKRNGKSHVFTSGMQKNQRCNFRWDGTVAPLSMMLLNAEKINITL